MAVQGNPKTRAMKFAMAMLLASALIAASVYQPAFAQSSPIKFLGHRSHSDTYGFFHVVGEVQNTGKTAITFVTISATFYDSAKKVVGTALTFTTISTLHPNEKSPFDVVLTDYEQIPKVASYKLTASSSPGLVKAGVLELRLGDAFRDTYGFHHQVGEVINKGSSTAHFVIVTGAFYDKTNQIAATGLTFTTPSDILPGESAPFDIVVVDGNLFAISSVSANVQSNEYAMMASKQSTQNTPEPTSAKQTQENQEYKAKLSLSASMTEKTKSMTVSLKNPKNSDAQVYELHLEFPDGALAKSAVAPAGWSKEVNGNSVTFSTEKKPIMANKSVKFNITLDKIVKSIDWDTYDEDGNIINSKTSRVIIRK